MKKRLQSIHTEFYRWDFEENLTLSVKAYCVYDRAKKWRDQICGTFNISETLYDVPLDIKEEDISKNFDEIAAELKKTLKGFTVDIAGGHIEHKSRSLSFDKLWEIAKLRTVFEPEIYEEGE